MIQASRVRLGYLVAPALVLLAACSTRSGESSGGGGAGGSHQQGTGGSPQQSSGSEGGTLFNPMASSGSVLGTTSTGSGVICDGMLAIIIRDFTTMTSPDFEQGNNVDDHAIVTADLGADGKPVYAGNPNTPTTKGKDSFDQWYRDVPDVNINIPIAVPLTQGANGVYTYDNQAFFPIDGQGFGNEGNNHNFHFTDEVHLQFTYKGGEIFTFSGDDDLFGYINKKLVINLGGIHVAETATVDLDQQAGTLGIKIGDTVPLDLFGAERHVTESHYRIDTTIDCIQSVTPPK